MYQDIPKTDPVNQPLVFAKIDGNHVDKLKKDDYVWHCQYEKILRITVAFIPVEEAIEQSDASLFERSVKIYLQNRGYKVKETKYYINADTLKQYLIIK